jgi:hypothetical protein
VSLTTANFTIEELESRFEMQTHSFEVDQQCLDCAGGGASYDYYGESWGNQGSGDGYTGIYGQDSNGNVMLDDGTYTDRSSGAFPSYAQQDPTCPQTPCPPNPNRGCKCNICRCRF